MFLVFWPSVSLVVLFIFVVMGFCCFVRVMIVGIVEFLWPCDSLLIAVHLRSSEKPGYGIYSIMVYGAYVIDYTWYRFARFLVK